MQGIANLTNGEAAHRRRRSREPPTRDLFHGDRARRPPEMASLRADHARGRCRQDRLNPFDLTKVWPHRDYPLIEVGVVELNRNPEIYFAEVEQASFSPANVGRGSATAWTRCCNSASSAYGDAQRTGSASITSPAGQPAACAVDNDSTATAQCALTAMAAARSIPSRQSAGPVEDPAFEERPLGDLGGAHRTIIAWQRRLRPARQSVRRCPRISSGNCSTISRRRCRVPTRIQRRRDRISRRSDPAYGQGVAERAGGSGPAAAAASRSLPATIVLGLPTRPAQRGEGWRDG